MFEKYEKGKPTAKFFGTLNDIAYQTAFVQKALISKPHCHKNANRGNLKGKHSKAEVSLNFVSDFDQLSYQCNTYFLPVKVNANIF